MGKEIKHKLIEQPKILKPYRFSKRFWIFGNNEYYQDGFEYDHLGSRDTLEDCMAFVNTDPYRIKFSSFSFFDTTTCLMYYTTSNQ